jgi:hypothetical protein
MPLMTSDSTGLVYPHLSSLLSSFLYFPFSLYRLFIYFPFYAGDQYVDWLSLDGYNSPGEQQWYQPGEIFDGIFIYFILFLYWSCVEFAEN